MDEESRRLFHGNTGLDNPADFFKLSDREAKALKESIGQPVRIEGWEHTFSWISDDEYHSDTETMGQSYLGDVLCYRNGSGIYIAELSYKGEEKRVPIIECGVVDEESPDYMYSYLVRSISAVSPQEAALWKRDFQPDKVSIPTSQSYMYGMLEAGLERIKSGQPLHLSSL